MVSTRVTKKFQQRNYAEFFTLFNHHDANTQFWIIPLVLNETVKTSIKRTKFNSVTKKFYENSVDQKLKNVPFFSFFITRMDNSLIQNFLTIPKVLSLVPKEKTIKIKEHPV